MGRVYRVDHLRSQHEQIDHHAGRQPRLVHALFERLATQRGPRRVLACLECGLERMTGADEGECPACGYLGWREAGETPRIGRPLALAARAAR